ncbi:putative permease [Mycoplasmopsis pulmonis]|nr:putative permease [Mycoplasmopsis pulmonis]
MPSNIKLKREIYNFTCKKEVTMKQKIVYNAKEDYYELSLWQKWIAIFITALGGGTIYLVPYLLYSFKSQMITVSQSNEQSVQLLLTVYGIFSLFLYIPGGWLADRVPAKTLFSFSMLSTGVVTIWYSLIAFRGIVDYAQLVIIHILFSFTTVLTFWSAFIKSIKMLGSPKEQASLYAKAETTRYALQLIANYISIGLAAIVIVVSPFVIFDSKGAILPNANAGEISSSSSSIFFSIGFYGLIYILTGVLSLFFLPGKLWDKNVIKKEDGSYSFYSVLHEKWYEIKNEFELKKFKQQQLKEFFIKVKDDTIKTLKSPGVWLTAMMIFFVMNQYTVYGSFGTTILQSLGAGEYTATALSPVYIYGIPIIGATAAGYLTKRYTKLTSKSLIWISLFTIGSAALLLIIFFVAATNDPSKNVFSPTILWISFVLVMLNMFFIGASRSIYWSTTTELKINPKILGLAIGFISIIGFSKDVWAGIFLAKIAENESLSSATYSHKALIYWGIFALINSVGALGIAYVMYLKVRSKKPLKDN